MTAAQFRPFVLQAGLAGLAVLLLLASTPPAAAAGAQEPAIELPIPDEMRDRTGPDGIPYEEALKRTLIYHTGPTQVFQETVGLLLEQEMERRKKAGEDLAYVDVTPEMVDARIVRSIEELEQNSPHADFWEQLDAQGYDQESYAREVRRTLLLDQLFFPNDPDLWNEEELKEIFPPDREEDTFGGFLESQRERLFEARDQGEEAEVDETIKQMLLRPTVVSWLWDQFEVKEPFHGLPYGVALQVGDRQVATDDLLARVMPKVGPVELERAAQWVELVWAVTEALAADEVLLSRDEALALMDEEMEEYVNSPISYEQMATEFLGFPSMQAYRDHFRLRMSYKKLLPDPLPDQVILEHRDKRYRFFGRGSVNSEVIWFSALNSATGAFPRAGDPFAEAHGRAEAAAAELRDGAEWSKVLDEYSDFPESYPGAHPSMPKPHRGRFGALERVPLRDFLGENDYPDFLVGYSIGDHIFFDAELGAVYGPKQGASGWYLWRVLSRSRPKNEIEPLENERHHFVVTDDYLTERFMEYVRRAMAESGSVPSEKGS